MILQQSYYFLFSALALCCVVVKLVRCIGQRTTRSVATSVVCGVVAAGALLLPVDGFMIWQWLYSAHANPSVPFLAMLVAILYHATTGRSLLTTSEWLILTCGIVFVGALLYAPIFIAPSSRIYALDWEGPKVTIAVTVCAVGLMALRNRIGVILLGVLIAHVADVLESDNLWDYLVDPVAWLVSVVIIAKVIFRAARARRAELAAPAAVPASQPSYEKSRVVFPTASQ